MDALGRLLDDPRTVPALIALIVAGTAFLRAETARTDARIALMRQGGRRKPDAAAAVPPAGTPERRKGPQ